MKVLYIGYVLLNDDSATGNTLHNIFSNSNIEILQCCTDYDLKRHSEKWPSFCVDKMKSYIYYLMRKVYRLLTEKSGVNQSRVSKAVSGHNKNVILSFLQGLMDIAPKRYSQVDLKKIDDYNPDIIYTLGENITVLKLARYFSKRCHAPIVLHIMDDIESNIYNEGMIVTPFRRVYQNILGNVYKDFKFHLAIGVKMAREFSKRHRCSFDFAMNCVEKVYPSEQPLNQPIKLLFSGGLHGGRNESLLEIANAINNSELRDKIKLHIYTSISHIKNNPDLSNACNMYEYVPSEKMIENLMTADILLHVESFKEEEIEYFKYSMSTKLPEYLSVNRPILCYGPMDINTVSFVQENKVGLVAQNIDDLIICLLKLTDAASRKTYASNSINIANDLFLYTSTQSRILDVFNKAIVNVV